MAYICSIAFAALLRTVNPEYSVKINCVGCKDQINKSIHHGNGLSHVNFKNKVQALEELTLKGGTSLLCIFMPKSGPVYSLHPPLPMLSSEKKK